MKTRENNKKRLAVDLDLATHCDIKKRAAFRNMTITEWIALAIHERILAEKKYE